MNCNSLNVVNFLWSCVSSINIVSFSLRLFIYSIYRRSTEAKKSHIVRLNAIKWIPSKYNTIKASHLNRRTTNIGFFFIAPFSDWDKMNECRIWFHCMHWRENPWRSWKTLLCEGKKNCAIAEQIDLEKTTPTTEYSMRKREEGGTGAYVLSGSLNRLNNRAFCRNDYVFQM